MKQANLTFQGQHYEELLKSLFNFQGPARDTRGYSSAGRAPALQAGGQRFDPAYLHQKEEPTLGALKSRPTTTNSVKSPK